MNNLLTNKYFVIALCIALVAAIIMYHKKKSCNNMERMRNGLSIPFTEKIINKYMPDTRKLMALKHNNRNKQINSVNYGAMSDNEFDEVLIKKYLMLRLNKN